MSSTPSNFFFSHLPAWVEALAWGMWRARAIIMAMACSAGGDGVAEGRVHDDDPFLGAGGHVDVVDAAAGAGHGLELAGGGENLFRNLGGGADGEAVILADDFGELVLVEADFGVGLDAAVGEDLGGGG